MLKKEIKPMKKQILPMSLLLSAAMTLSACTAKAPETIYEAYADVSEGFTYDIIESLMGEKHSVSTRMMNPKNSEILRNAVLDIKLDNSRIALPVAVCDLPQEFAVSYGKSYEFKEYGYTLYISELEAGGKFLTDAFVIVKDGRPQTDGVIIALTAYSDNTKWSVGEAESCDIEALEAVFGEPSSDKPLSENTPVSYSYIADSGEFAMFTPEASGVMLFALDCTQLEANKAYLQYSPCEDFTGLTDFPPLTGEQSFDPAWLLYENGITIGDFTCPADITVADLKAKEDITLIYTESEPYKIYGEEIENQVKDSYMLLYKGRSIGTVQSRRSEEQTREEADCCRWLIKNRADLPCDVSVAGIPCSQPRSELEKVFEFSAVEELGYLELYGYILDETKETQELMNISFYRTEDDQTLVSIHTEPLPE